METIRNTAEEIKEEKTSQELTPENLEKVSGGTSNGAEENKKKKRCCPHPEQEEANHKRKP